MAGLVINTSIHVQVIKSTSDSAKKNACHLQAMDQSQLPQPPGLELQQDSTLEHLELNENLVYGPIIVINLCTDWIDSFLMHVHI